MMDLSVFIAALNNQIVYVYGLGKSGLATVAALSASGARVVAWDNRESQRREAASLGAVILSEDDLDFNDLACVILSPGIPLTHPAPHSVVTKVAAHHVEVIGDVEILGRCLPSNIKTVGITGTNGKSTTTALMGHILKECGVEALVGGNIGTPVLSFDIKKSLQVIVLELSSYQIDLCPTFHPDIGVLLNITPDHIDRHGSLEQYAAVKQHMFGEDTRAIISVDDALSRHIYKKRKDAVDLTLQKSLPFDPIDFKALAGVHNHQNALAAYYVCRELGLDAAQVVAAMKTFPGLAHRQQNIRQIGGVSYINDSKATNAEAAAKALATYDDIYWILGGQSKAGGLSGLEMFMPRIKKAYLIGAAAADFSVWLQEQNIPFDISFTLDRAIMTAHADAQKTEEKGVVLLSPACASWDQFESFEHRGDVFAGIVLGL